MKTERLRQLMATALAGAGMLIAGSAAASGSTTVTVNGEVIAVCTFSSTTYTLTLANDGNGKIDPSVDADATGSVAVKYKCTNGQTPTFTVPTPATLVSGANNLSATISSTNEGAGAGFTTEKTLTVSGTIAKADHRVAKVGAYTVNITVSVTP